jgi:hypothetical protein
MTKRIGKCVGGIVMAMALIVPFTAVFLTPACGGATPQVRVSSPFTEEHAKYFEDGVDLVKDPTSLDGRWRDEWQADLDRRVGLSDLIARVKVSTVRSIWDLDHTVLQLDLTVQEQLHGTSAGESLVVSVREGDVGFPSVKTNQARLLNADYLVFVKWYVGDVGRPVAHWHLAPDTDAIRGLVTSRVALLHQAPPPRQEESW